MQVNGKSKPYYQMLIRKSIIVLVTLLSIVMLFKFLMDHIWNLTYHDPYIGEVNVPYENVPYENVPYV